MSNYYKKYLKYKEKYLNLKNGGHYLHDQLRIQEIPQLCFGTGQGGFYTTLPDAFKAGYRHIDGADIYEGTLREYTEIMGKSYFDMVKECIKLVSRNDLWITWKTSNLSIENIKEIIRKLDCEYIDLLLDHHGCNLPSEDAVKLGLIRYYGVSNCEDTDALRGKNIFANQVQARPPVGNLSTSGNFNTFVNECNGFGVKIMLYGSTSSLGDNPRGYFYDNKSLVNKYYFQKYIKGKQNILIVSSQTGYSINLNMEDYKKIKRGEDLLTPEQMAKVEGELERYRLRHM